MTACLNHILPEPISEKNERVLTDHLKHNLLSPEQRRWWTATNCATRSSMWPHLLC